uniref:Protein FAM169B isoform X2 n=1 Tax=Geotrypetes seraphini TaxID=260995 RepID=A0A6P8PMN2_GEOSA|nr:protein FAM169B isoform X2 [Geotrypetes seraphini]
MEGAGGRRRSGPPYPVDVSAQEGASGFWVATNAYYSKLVQQRESSTEIFSISDEEKVKIEESNISRLPLYQEDSEHRILVLVNPKDKAKVLAAYVKNSWWGTEDILKTSDPSREGVIQVDSFEERVVLFVLNCLIFGTLERSPSEDGSTFFVPHSAEEYAKIFWQAGQAVGFYTVKRKGNLCDDCSSLCYLLPVLDTIFVRKKCRKRGLGMRMLWDFCQSFSDESVLGISCPLSAAMYQGFNHSYFAQTDTTDGGPFWIKMAAAPFGFLGLWLLLPWPLRRSAKGRGSLAGPFVPAKTCDRMLPRK